MGIAASDANMTRYEVIDLLSSDDEVPAKFSGLGKEFGAQEAKSTAKRRAKSTAKSTDFTFLSDDPEDAVDLNGWKVEPAKRRKLSPPINIEGTHPIPQLSYVSGDISPPRISSRPMTAVDRKNEWIDLSDPIISSSSPREKEMVSRPRKCVNLSPRLNDESCDEFPDDPRSVSLQHPVVSQVSDRTAALLASLQAPTEKRSSNGRKNSGKNLEAKAKEIPVESEHDEEGSEVASRTSGKPAATKSSRRPKLLDTEKAAKAQEKEASKAAEKARRAKEKEDEKEKKRLAKEEKAREKQIAADLAEVNRSKMDKKLTTPEMIVDLPASIDGQSVNTQAREILKNLGVDTNVYQSPVPNVIKWRRKVDRVYNTEKGHWDPLRKNVIQEEKHIMCLMTAKEFVALATADSADLDNQDLEWHVHKLKSYYKDCTPIYTIEGLNAWMRKNKTIRNRAYQAAVLNQDTQGNISGANEKQAPKRKKTTNQYVDEDMIEDALLRLQVIDNCLIHHTAATVETAEWVANFTQHISTIPYKHVLSLSVLHSRTNRTDRRERMNLDTSFCMESGQFHSGKDAHDTYLKMLQEVTRVTASVAQGISQEYPDVASLVEGFSKSGSTALEDIKVCGKSCEGWFFGLFFIRQCADCGVCEKKAANKNGAISDRRIGPAISKTLYRVFMNEDYSIDI